MSEIEIDGNSRKFCFLILATWLLAAAGVRDLEDFVGMDADESYMGEASVYKAQLCAQL